MSESIELELQMVVSSLMYDVGTEPGSSARAASVLKL